MQKEQRKLVGSAVRNNLYLILSKMKSYRKELWFETPTRRAFLNITGQVGKCLSESGIREGLVLVNAMHITSCNLHK